MNHFLDECRFQGRDINEGTMGISLSVLVGIGIYELVQYRREKEKEKSRRSTQVSEVGKEEEIRLKEKNRSAFVRLRQPLRSRRRSNPSSSDVRPAEKNTDEYAFDVPPPYTPTLGENTRPDSVQLAWAKL